MLAASVENYENILFNPSLNITQKREVGKTVTVERLIDNDLNKTVAKLIITAEGANYYVAQF